MAVGLQRSASHRDSISTVWRSILLPLATLWLCVVPASWGQSLLSAVLPSSRSVQVGTAATAFATIINTGPATAMGCQIAPLIGLPASFLFQTTDCATNQLTGTPGTPVDIRPAIPQCFVLAFTPSGPIAPVDVPLNFDCTNTDPAPIVPGLNTLLLSASPTPVPDVVALSATLQRNGIVDIPGTTGTGVFAVATVNLGSGARMTVSADTGGVSLPLSVLLCRTDPTTGVCVASPTSQVTTQIGARETPTFGIFVGGSGTIPLDPATNRIFVRFKDDAGMTRGSTSVAVRTIVPDIRGTYSGSGTILLSKCLNPLSNGTFPFSTTVNIASQVGAAFGGTGSFTTVVSGLTSVSNITFTGIVTEDGQLSGPFTFTTVTGGVLVGVGDGTFTGSVTQDTLQLNLVGQFRAGETCVFVGSLTGTR